jgi:hypothetical protein
MVRYAAVFEEGLVRVRIVKFTAFFLFISLVPGVWALSESFAGQVAKEITVDKEGGGDSRTITEALNNIIDATETNRYRIRVSPGTYNEQVVMKSHVDLSGSGQNNTIITHDMDGPTILWPAHDVSLENLTITGKGPARDLVFIEGSAVIRNVKIVIPDSTKNGVSTSSGASLEFIGSTITVTSESGGFTGIFFDDGILLVDKSSIEIRTKSGSPSQGIIAERAKKATLKRSLITIKGNGYGITAKNAEIIESNISVHSPVAVINDVIGVVSWGKVSILNSEIAATAQAPTKRTVAVDVSGDNTVIRNSLVSSDFFGIKINMGLIEVVESTISGKSLGITKPHKGIFEIRNSRIIGGYDGDKGIDKVINCIDENTRASTKS